MMIMGHPRQAIAAYHKALRIDEHFAGAHAALGDSLRELGRFDEAGFHDQAE